MEFKLVGKEDEEAIASLSSFATALLRVYYDSIIGKRQNDYHLAKFQSTAAIKGQLEEGYTYYCLSIEGKTIGFFAYYPRKDALYLSKFYIDDDYRGLGYGQKALLFLLEKAEELGLSAIELNVNKHNPTTAIYEHLGFKRIKEEVIAIGGGFYMDDYVYRLESPKKRSADE